MTIVNWSPKAVDSLNKLVDFIEIKWDKKVTNKLLDEIDQIIEIIKLNPKIYPLFSRKKHQKRIT
ncbi:MAG: hypothetical protein A2033_14535 [Bacteroidetes bacterium GWA2_31_9]|nr:MAG: hypothetical protein A2033_14535 [Bacteroidetes bacterium GWA2_31_9]